VGDGTEKDALLLLAKQLNVSNQLLMPGFIRDPENWMARSEIFVLPSRFEGFPNALLEAMSIGCAAIAFDCNSGPREIIRDGVNGLLVPAGDVDALGAAIARLAADKNLRSRVGSQATLVREMFSKKAVLAKWDHCFEVLSKTGAIYS
jgi:glycosyltransferase involved in cell wall biosynthesis